MASTFFATLAIVSTSTIHGKTSRPVGTKESTDKSILKKMTLLTIIKHIEANIRHQPVKISDVFRLPPTPKASGAQMVSIPRITYRSAISNIRPKTLNMTMMPMIMTKIHAAPIPP
ncbi:MAG: hypothetical protein EOM58_05215, partial [Clostridia bacterium]|nr:hypothetical protein [Clostridia bacterium]